MAKKGAKSSKKKDEMEKESNSPEKSTSLKSDRNENVSRMLVENFIALQSVMADLTSKLNNLANQISKLLELFEESAKTFMEKDIKFGEGAGGGNKEIAEKLDKLLEQNKIIARGLALLHESNAQEEQSYGQQQQFMPPQYTQQTPALDQANRYQRSISSR